MEKHNGKNAAAMACKKKRTANRKHGDNRSEMAMYGRCNANYGAKWNRFSSFVSGSLMFLRRHYKTKITRNKVRSTRSVVVFAILFSFVLSMEDNGMRRKKKKRKKPTMKMALYGGRHVKRQTMFFSFVRSLTFLFLCTPFCVVFVF